MPLFEINGTRVYADIRGADDAPPLLFIHGGPGQSAFDFMRVQGDPLSASVRVIGVDQRGLLRSDPLTGYEDLTAELIIADFEALRTELGYDSWAILGHSVGGWLATAYAHKHPESVSAVVFDSPGWDADVANRHRLALVADILDEEGDDEGASRARALMTLPRRMTYADDAWAVLGRAGERIDEIVFHDPAVGAALVAARAASEFTDEDFDRGDESHVAALRPRLFESAFPLLAELTRPSMLLRGRYDAVVPPVAVAAYEESVPDPRVVTFDSSAHIPYLEEPVRYAEVVAAFVTGRTL